MKLTKEQFTENYCKKLSPEFKAKVLERSIALPCHCGGSSCKGWAMVENDEFCISVHNELYGEQPIEV